MSDKLSGESLLQKYYDQLVTTIGRHIDTILRRLVSGTDGVITIDEKITIKNYGKTPWDKAEHLLDEYIRRSLCVRITNSLLKLLKVMKEISAVDCNRLAATIEQEFVTIDAFNENVSASDEVTNYKGKDQCIYGCNC